MTHGSFKQRIIRATDADEFSNLAAQFIVTAIDEVARPIVILPTGKTPLGPYRTLVELYADRIDLWARTRFVALDEYIGLGPDDPRLFSGWLAREIFDPLHVPVENRIMFDSAAKDPHDEITRMEAWLNAHGPVTLAVLGLGGNGHIAFNEPGTPFDSTTHILTLTDDSVAANARYWGDAARVPPMAMTLGLKNLAAADQTLLLVNGSHKAEILRQTLHGAVTTACPATYLHTIENVTIIADDAALGV